MDSKIFKAYDIRGLYPEEFNEKVAYKVGRAMVVFSEAKRVVIGRDMRESSDSIFEALASGVMDQGADVINIGKCTTPMLDFAVGNFEPNDAGVMITASHNPKEYNGLKLVKSDASSIGIGIGMEEIRDMAVRDSFPNPMSGRKGEMGDIDILEDYIKKICEFVDIKKISPLKIAVDGGNGMIGIPLTRILKDLPCRATELFLEPDGNFPNHHPNPSEEKNLEDLKKAVLLNECDLGIAFDGDGDRCRFIDEKGNSLRGDIVTVILAREFLKKNPGRAIVHDLISSWIVDEEVKNAGGVPVSSKVGHSYIKTAMRKENAIFGGEMSGHFYHSSFFGAESAILTMLMFLETMSVEKKKVSELSDPLFKYWHTGEINFHVHDKEAKMQEIEQRYADGAKSVSREDGVKIEYEDWWFNVRPSNTEPLLRLNLEAKTKEMMEVKKEELVRILEN
jgi:phosphomannomutase